MTDTARTTSTSKSRSHHICLIAGEHSGDALGGPLMAALQQRVAAPWTFSGIGGECMEAQGMRSLFPLSEVAIMGPLAILARLPSLIRRVHQAADAVVAAKPDALVIIDSPEFTHAVAKRVRKRLPQLPIIDYVSPSVWAWRPGRARRMTAYVNHVLAILPFEPEAHRQLGGPACTYVGHPLIERLGEFAPDQAARAALPATLLVMPGSRVTEVRRLMAPFGAALELVAAQFGAFRLVLPATGNVRQLVQDLSRDWPLRPEIVSGEAAKLAAFRTARGALVASGTATLELALARVPMAVAYRLDPVASALRFLLKAHSVVLPNLVLGENIVPEFIQERCTPQLLADALLGVLRDGPARQSQLSAFDRVIAAMSTGDVRPSTRAAEAVLRELERD